MARPSIDQLSSQVERTSQVPDKRMPSTGCPRALGHDSLLPVECVSQFESADLKGAGPSLWLASVKQVAWLSKASLCNTPSKLVATGQSALCTVCPLASKSGTGYTPSCKIAPWYRQQGDCSGQVVVQLHSNCCISKASMTLLPASVRMHLRLELTLDSSSLQTTASCS